MNRSVVKLKAVMAFILLSMTAMAQNVAKKSVRIERNELDNTPKTIVLSEHDRHLLIDADVVLNQYLNLPAENNIAETNTTTTGYGLITRRYGQWYKGLKIEHASFTIVAKDSLISFMHGNVFAPANLNAAPVLNEHAALDYALKSTGAKSYMWQDASAEAALKQMMRSANASYQPKGELVWVEDFNLKQPDRRLHLAYKFDVFAKEPMSRNLVYVDANTGNILLKDAVMKHVAATGATLYSGTVSIETMLNSSGSYQLNDMTRGNGIFTYDANNSIQLTPTRQITNATTTWPKDKAIDAHWGSEKVYDYFLSVHNRKSYDDKNAPIIGYVNYDIKMDNAYWTGGWMIYGNGSQMMFNGYDPLVSLDVCAHEIGHGVCQTTSGLVYNKESGAINEGFSDIWGMVIENYYQPDKQAWYMGEQLGIRPIRNFKCPKELKNPDTYNGQYWVDVVNCTPPANDNCGVHYNSGIMNRWFYLLSEGGEGTNDLNNKYAVNGIGISKAARIAYATELVLSPTANYADCRTASINTAATFYGPCSKEAEAVTRAWYAVGVGSAFAPCAPQIGFAFKDTIVEMGLPGNICPSAQSIMIPMKVTGPAPTGANTFVTVREVGNVPAADYAITNPVIFPAGSNAMQQLHITIYHNGDVTNDKVLKLYMSIAGGSNATASYTYDTCYIRFRGKNIPDTGGNVAKQLFPSSKFTHKAITPFYGKKTTGNLKYIVTAKELINAGINPNDSINGMAINITEKNTTLPFGDYTIRIDTTTMDHPGYVEINASKQYYFGNYTTKVGWNYIPFTPKLKWNGTANLLVEACFMSAAASAEPDYVDGYMDTSIVCRANYADWTFSGCYLGFPYESHTKPVTRFYQSKPVTRAEQMPYTTWQLDLHMGHDVYFCNDTNRKVILNIAKPDHDLGCATAAITAQGSGMAAMTSLFAPATRTIKEFAVNVSKNAAVTDCDVTLFFDSSEIAGIDPAKARMVSTTAAQDSQMNVNNTQQQPITVVTNKNYIGYKGSFTGIGTRFFITGDELLLPVVGIGSHNRSTQNIRVNNNPFEDKIYVSYSLNGNTRLQIKMCDVTGKTVYMSERVLQSGNSSTVIDLSHLSLASGTYILQLVSDHTVVTEKMIKN